MNIGVAVCTMDLSAGITAIQSRPCAAPGPGQALPYSHPPVLITTLDKNGSVVRRQDAES